MSRTVDSRTVEMRFDNKNFESNVKQSMSTLDKLKQKLKLDGASKGLEEVERSSRKLDFKDTNESVGKLGKSFSALETIATGVFLRIGMAAADAGAKIIKSFSVDQISAGWDKYAQKTSAVQTIMANLKNDTGRWIDDVSKMEYVTEQLDKLMTFSDETSYRFINMTQNVGKFVSSGLDLEEVVTAMQGIAGLAGLAGKTPEQAEIVFDTFSKSITRGYVSARDFYNIQTVMTAEAKEQAIAIGEELGLIDKGTVTISNFRDSFIGKGGKSWFNKDVIMRLLKLYGSGADKVLSKMKELGVSSTEALRQLEKDDAEFAKSIGYRAFKADQEAKTFREAMDATADAVSSKWSAIFENIFGDYLQARKLWTDLSEDLWNIFAAPLDDLNDIMSIWNRGFFDKKNKTALETAFESGTLEDVESRFNYVTKEAAEMAVAIDSGTYAIRELEDGTKELITRIKGASGEYEYFSKKIFEADETFLSGRDMLISGFKNLLDTFFHDTEDEDGNEILSVLGAIKKAFMEIFFPGTNTTLGRNLWELTKKFKEFTERIKPTQETIEKIKNSFKGLFTLFKIAGKFIKSVITPFKNAFKILFGGDISKGVLNATDGFSTWIQKLEEFLDTSKTFEKISKGITDGLNFISETFTGLSLNDLLTKIRKNVSNFFKNFDFQKFFKTIRNWLNKINFKGIFSTITRIFTSVIDFIKRAISEISQLNTDQLPEKLTPIQSFWLGLKEIFKAIKIIVPAIVSFFKKIVTSIGNTIGGLSKLSEPFRKITSALGDFFSHIFGTVKKNDAVTSGISEGIKKTEKVSKEGSKFIETLKSSSFIKGMLDFLKGLVFLLDSIGPLLGQVGTFFGKLFVAIGSIIRYFSKNSDGQKLGIIVTGLLTILGLFIAVQLIARRIKKKIASVKKTLETVYSLFANISSIINGYKAELSKKNKYETIRSVAMLVIAIGVSLTLMSIAAKQAGGIGNFGIIAGILGAFILVVLAVVHFSDKILKKTDLNRLMKILAITSGFMKEVAKTLITVAVAFKLMSLVDPSSFGWISLIFAGYMAAITGIAIIVMKAFKSFTVKKVIANLASISGLAIAMAISLNLLAKAFAKFARIKFKNATIEQISLIFAGYMLIVGGLAIVGRYLVGDVKAIFGIAMMAGLMITAASSLNLVANAFKIMAGISFDNSSLKQISLVFGGFMLIAGGLAVVGRYLLGNVKAIIGVAMMAGFMFTAALSLAVLALAFNELKGISKSDLGAVLAIMGVFAALVAVLSVIGTILVNTGVGAAGMALVALIITAIGFACIAAGAGIALFNISATKLIETLIYLADRVEKDGIAFVDALGEMFVRALNIIGDARYDMFIAFYSIGAAIAEAIYEVAPIIAEALIAIFKYVIKIGIETLESSMDVIGLSLTKLFIALIHSISANLRIYAPELVRAFRDLLESLTEVFVLWIASIIEVIPGLGPAAAQAIIDSIPDIREHFKVKAGTSILDKVAEENIKAAESGEIAGNALTDLSGIIKNLFSEFDGEGGFWNNLFGDGEGGGVKGFLQNLFGINDFPSFFGNQMQGVSEAVKKETPEMQASLKKAFDTGVLDDIESRFDYVSRSAAKAAVELDPSKYAMRTLDDGTEQLVTRVKNAKGEYEYFVKTIYDSEEPITSAWDKITSALSGTTDELVLSAKTSGSDYGLNWISGLKSSFGELEKTMKEFADIPYSYTHCSEPDKGPLSDLHTYGPDMVKEWCKGINNNLGMVDESSNLMSSRIKEGFATALDYISNLIDGGMTDELTIRPIMDLSEIQNGVKMLDSMLSGRNGYPLYGTAGSIASAAYGMQSGVGQQINPIQQNSETNNTFNNTFNITNGDPNAVAEKVSRILNNQVKRHQAIWATK